jgi:large subunit ribosomal protein L18
MKKTQKQRKQQRKTNYSKRLNLLKSNIERVIIRKTNNYLIVQIVESFEAKDKVIIGVTSKDLLSEGWPKNLEGSLKSLPASYLTGLLAGKKFKEKNKTQAIVDLGLQRNKHGGRIYAVLKGIVDAGIKINVDEKVFPGEERIKGKHLSKEVEKAFEIMEKKLK